MQVKTSKSGDISETVIHSEQITIALIQQLKKLLANNVYLTYKTSYTNNEFRHELNLDGQLEFIFGKPLDRTSVQNIRLARDVWNNMELINRLAVLDSFSTLYHEALTGYNSMEKTILFCQIFINDFVSIIACH